MKEANTDTSLRCFTIKRNGRGGNGFKEEFKMCTIKAGLQTDGSDPLKGEPITQTKESDGRNQVLEKEAQMESGPHQESCP